MNDGKKRINPVTAGIALLTLGTLGGCHDVAGLQQRQTDTGKANAPPINSSPNSTADAAVDALNNFMTKQNGQDRQNPPNLPELMAHLNANPEENKPSIIESTLFRLQAQADNARTAAMPKALDSMMACMDFKKTHPYEKLPDFMAMARRQAVRDTISAGYEPRFARDVLGVAFPDAAKNFGLMSHVSDDIRWRMQMAPNHDLRITATDPDDGNDTFLRQLAAEQAGSRGR